MSANLFSPHWYRIAQLRPSLRAHIKVERHCYRSEVWYLLRDELTGRQHRLSWAAFQMVGRLDSRLTTEEVWLQVVDILGDSAPTQTEVIETLGQLNSAELLQSDASADVAALFVQRDRRTKQRRLQKINPLAFRVTLGDPSKLVDAIAPLLGLFLKPWVFFLLLAFFAVCVINAAQDWTLLKAYGKSHFSQPSFLLTMWLVYPLVKFVHELAHGATIRAWGAHVKEYGITLMLFFPVPYIDASAASSFRSKTRRATVSLMGILAELTMAGFAYWYWVGASEGWLREVAFAIMFTCAVSTVLANANPLMKFDGYYVLTDWLESPNLAQRSTEYWKYIGLRYIYGASGVLAPIVGRGERWWLIGYGFASYFYRWVLFAITAIWLTEYTPVLGAIFAGWIFMLVLVLPAWKVCKFTFGSPLLDRCRARSFAALTAGVFTTVLALTMVPISQSTLSTGVVWVSDDAAVRSQVDGMVAQVYVQNGQFVEVGQLLAQLEDPSLATEIERAQSRVRAIEVSLQLALAKSAGSIKALSDDLERVQDELDLAIDKQERMALRAKRSGRVFLTNHADLMGSWIGKGAVVGHVLNQELPIVRVVIRQDEVALVRDQTKSIQVRTADSGLTAFEAVRRSDQPASTQELPTAALGEKGGGEIAIDPTDPQGIRTLEPVFLMDLQLKKSAGEQARIGSRAWVRFEHRHDSIASWLTLQIERARLKYLDYGSARVASR